MVGYRGQGSSNSESCIRVFRIMRCQIDRVSYGLKYYFPKLSQGLKGLNEKNEGTSGFFGNRHVLRDDIIMIILLWGA